MASEPQVHHDVYFEACAALRRPFHDPKAVLQPTSGTIGAYVQHQGDTYSFVVDPYETADGRMHLLAISSNDRYSADVIYLGPASAFQDARRLLVFTERVSVDFVTGGRESSGYTTPHDPYSLRPGPWFVHVHRRQQGRWEMQKLRLSMRHVSRRHRLAVPSLRDVPEAIRNALRGFVDGL